MSAPRVADGGVLIDTRKGETGDESVPAEAEARSEQMGVELAGQLIADTALVGELQGRFGGELGVRDRHAQFGLTIECVPQIPAVLVGATKPEVL